MNKGNINISLTYYQFHLVNEAVESMLSKLLREVGDDNFASEDEASATFLASRELFKFKKELQYTAKNNDKQ